MKTRRNTISPGAATKRARAAAALVALAALAAACGSDDDTAATTTTAATAASTASSGATVSSSPTASSASSPASSAPSSSAAPAVSSASSAPASSAPSKAASEKAPRCKETAPGSKLTFNVLASPGKLDPTLISGGVVGGTETAALYDTLFMYDDETAQVIPHLAEGISANADFTKFTLKLRSGIAFSDGTPFDADMVAKNFARFFSPTTIAPQKSLGFMIGSTKVVDPTTLEVDMTQPWAEFPVFLTEQLGMIVNLNVVGADVQVFSANPPEAAGVGPYVLERNAPGEEITFRARKNYWGGAACTESLRIVANPDGRMALETLQSKEIDGSFTLDREVLDQAESEGYGVNTHEVDVGVFLLLNNAPGKIGADVRVREALWRAIDPKQVSERVYAGNLRPAASLINPKSVWASPGMASADYDLDRAKQLVAEAKAAGVNTTFAMAASPSTRTQDMALAIQSQLQAAGFTVTIETKQINDQVTAVRQGNYDAALSALSIEPAQIASRLYISLFSTSPGNSAKFASPDMDAAINAALAASSADRKAAIAKVNDVYVKNYVSPVLSSSLNGIFFGKDVSGIIVNPTNVFLMHNAQVKG